MCCSRAAQGTRSVACDLINRRAVLIAAEGDHATQKMKGRHQYSPGLGATTSLILRFGTWLGYPRQRTYSLATFFGTPEPLMLPSRPVHQTALGLGFEGHLLLLKTLVPRQVLRYRPLTAQHGQHQAAGSATRLTSGHPPGEPLRRPLSEGLQ